MSTSSLTRPNRFEVDLGAIAHNVREVRRLVGDSTRIVCALKADAYGFGLGPVAETVVANGGDLISVADMSDAVFLRDHGIQIPILLYPGNLPEADTVAAIEAHRLMPTIFDRESARFYSSNAHGAVRVFVKVDVGLERFGIPAPQAVEFVKEVCALPNLEVRGVYAHVDVPDAPGSDEYINWQFETYTEVCQELEDTGFEIPIKMVASSAVLGFSPVMSLSAVDPGHMLFGLLPPGPRTVDVELHPALHALKSRLIHTRKLDRKEFVEMMSFPVREDMRFGVIPIGLRDGMASINGGRVLLRGRSVPILGPISLEHTRVDLTDVPDAQVGDEVVLIGTQGGDTISAEEVRERQGFGVKAELVLAIRESVPRVYV